jgi:hypothetical protein
MYRDGYWASVRSVAAAEAGSLASAAAIMRRPPQRTHVIVDGVGAGQVGARVLAGALVVRRRSRARVLHKVAAGAGVAAARKHVQQSQPVAHLIS